MPEESEHVLEEDEGRGEENDSTIIKTSEEIQEENQMLIKVKK